MALTTIYLLVLISTGVFSMLVTLRYRWKGESLLTQKRFFRECILTLTGSILLALFLFDLIAAWIVYAVTSIVILLHEYVSIALNRRRSASILQESRASDLKLEDSKGKERWERIRAKGFRRFVLRYTAICAFSLAVFTGFLLIVSPGETSLSLWLGLNLALILAAVIAAVREWNWMQKRYSGFDEPLK
jgi:hypothetical protein